jgi:predicted transcriptional regulator
MWLKHQSGASLLGELESVLMEWMWGRGEASVPEARAECVPHLAHTTVLTTMIRLYKKGLLKRRQAGRAHIYATALTKEEYQRHVMHYLLEMVLGENSGAVLSHFVNAVSVDEEMLERLDQLVKAKRRRPPHQRRTSMRRNQDRAPWITTGTATAFACIGR